MRIGFYPKLALDGIRKNKRMYPPYILTCIGMVMMTYILAYLRTAEAVAALRGGWLIQEFMNIGVYILIFFSLLFLSYTNAFLMRRRKKEFGLYNILGMDKKNIGRILLWETFFVALFSMVPGLIGGVAFSKLAELGIVRIMEGETSYTLSISVGGVVFTVIPFAVIFILLFLNSLRQLWFSNAISLLRSETAGEKPPKANWLLGILGILILGAAYYIAVTIKDPISAILAFLIAVLMVIAATYLIMIAGSVWFCRILQKRKGYYYKPGHFVSVSSMVYRMRRNGAGLASICILATMVLVMISSTSALFIGGEDMIYSRYPREINTEFRLYENKQMTGEDTAFFRDTINRIVDAHGGVCDHVMDFRMVGTAGLLNGGDVIYDASSINFDMGSYSDLVQIYLIPLEDYNAMTGRDVELAYDEALVYAYRIHFDGEEFGFQNARHYKVKEHLSEWFGTGGAAMVSIVPLMFVVVPDIYDASEGMTDAAGNEMFDARWNYCFDTSLDDEEDIELHRELKETFKEMKQNGRDNFVYEVYSREYERADFFSLYGGIFYLGIILSTVFIFAAVLIIYYKQVSEGYEDQSRYEIMQKVGMTKRDIRKSINSQLLTVFFLPLFGAGLHLAFAFPIIEKLLLLFNLHNHTLFVCTTIGSFLVFALFYVVVYRITAGAYYQIVSGAKDRE
ncbi:MAG: ABC transporter permease [Agathobacter sp.]|nr:ABC transporter permease [Agathobacter sp.]